TNATLFPLGTTTATFRFRDIAGNPASANSSVTVVAGGAPAISASIVGKGNPRGAIFFYDTRGTNTRTRSPHNLPVKQFSFQTLIGNGKASYNADASPPLPISLGNLAAGASKTVRVFFTVPPPVSQFRVTESGEFQNASGQTSTFTTNQVVTR